VRDASRDGASGPRRDQQSAPAAVASRRSNHRFVSRCSGRLGSGAGRGGGSDNRNPTQVGVPPQIVLPIFWLLWIPFGVALSIHAPLQVRISRRTGLPLF
jgi:hypothetical protein